MPLKVRKSNKKRNGQTRAPRDNTKNEVSKFAGDAYDLGRRAIAGVAYLKNLINIETKQYDISQLLAPGAGGNGTVDLLSQIGQGLDYDNRVGDSIKLQRLEFHFSVSRHPSATSTRMRLLILRDNLSISLPAVTDILAVGCYHLAPFAKLAVDTERFGVLVDHSTILDASHLSEVHHVEMAHNGHIKFQSSSGTSFGHGNIIIYYWSSEVTNLPDLYLFTRMFYTDD
jgi:hypothetical protein